MFEIRSIKPREYQQDALEKAKRQDGSILCLPTGTGKTLVGLMYACYLLNKKEARRILILEPTRFLVKQVTEYYRKNSNIQTEMLYGEIEKNKRIQLWKKGDVVITTPQTAFNDIDYLDFEAIIIDECHHTTGEHAYAKLMQNHVFKYRLGLTATLPKNKESEIKNYIGEVVFTWGWMHPDVKCYVPDWYGEVYDCDFDNNYKKVYEHIMKIRKRFENTTFAGLCSTAIRMLCRDGAIALKETLEKKNELSEFLKDEIYNELTNCSEAHKLEQMKKIIEQHDFDKAIVFVDRVVLARYLETQFKDLNPVLLLGRMHSGSDKQKDAVRRAVDERVMLVISTSAGEEGIDLPTADLLIVWSNTVNVVRFIQRTGRIMRKSEKSPNKLKIATYIATPDSPDYDALWNGLCAAADVGVNVPGIDPEALSKGLVIERVNNFLQLNPTSIMDIAEALNLETKRAKNWLNENVNRGKLFYFYLFPFDPIKKATAIKRALNGTFDDYLEKDIKRFNNAIKEFADLDLNKRNFVDWIRNDARPVGIFLNYVCNNLTTENRIYALQDEASLVLSDFSEFFKVPQDFSFHLAYRFSNKDKEQHKESIKGTSAQIFNKIIKQTIEKKVFLNFSTADIYTGAKINYSGRYSENALRLIIKNAGWICWNIHKMNEIICGK
jgi:ERCC4-related helicase